MNDDDKNGNKLNYSKIKLSSHTKQFFTVKKTKQTKLSVKKYITIKIH
jgi:hypothetical protein